MKKSRTIRITTHSKPGCIYDSKRHRPGDGGDCVHNVALSPGRATCDGLLTATTPPAFQAQSSDEQKGSTQKFSEFFFSGLIEIRLTIFRLIPITLEPFIRSEVSKAALNSRAYAGLLVIGAVSPKSRQELSAAGYGFLVALDVLSSGSTQAKD